MSGCLCSDDEKKIKDCYDYSWLSTICRNHGLDKVFYSKGGYTTQDWVRGGYMQQMQNDNCNAYFVALGTNDKNQSYPMGNIDSETTEESFSGYYKKLLQTITLAHPNAKIFCFSLYDKSSEKSVQYSNLIKQIADYYNYYYVDIANESDVLVYDDEYTSGYHYTTIGYVRLAKNIEKIINRIISNNKTDFLMFGFDD